MYVSINKVGTSSKTNGYAVIISHDTYFEHVKTHSDYDDALYHAATIANLDNIELKV